jgi:hypothetical protein
MSPHHVSRRAALTALSLWLPSLLAGCGGEEVPTSFEPLRYDYYPRIRLNVAVIDIDDAWTPRPGSGDVGSLAPTPPLEALRRMAEDRLAAAGATGRATFTIEAASITQSDDTYRGMFAVRLDIDTANGSTGYAEARVARDVPVKDDSAAGVRADLYNMVRRMMADMNVEFEYQIRQSLRPYLQTGAPSAPAPAPVESQPLPPPATEFAPTLTPTPAPTPSPAPVRPSPPPAFAPTAPSAVPFAVPTPTPLSR